MPTTPEQARQRGRAARAGSKTKSEALKKNPYCKNSWFFPNYPELYYAFIEGGQRP